MVQVNNKHRCSVCNSEINAYEFYMTEDKKQNFCSVDCAKQRLGNLSILKLLQVTDFVLLIDIVNN